MYPAEKRELVESRSSRDAIRSSRSYPHRAQMEPASSGVTPAFALRVFRQWWMFVIPTGCLLAAGAGYLVWHFHEPQYEAKALIMIEDMAPFIAFDNREGGKGTSDKYVQTQIELLKSDSVLQRALTQGLSQLAEFQKQDPLGHLQKSLSIRQVGKSELYYICFVSPSADNAAKVVNTVVKEYLTFQGEDDFDRSQRLIDLLEAERVRREGEVRRLRGRVVDVAKEVTGKDPFNQGAVIDFERAMTPAASLYQSLTDVDVNIEMLKAEIQSLRESKIITASNAETSGLADLEVNTHPDVQRAQAEIENIKMNIELHEARTKQIRPDNYDLASDPTHMQLQTMLGVHQQKLEELKTTVRDEQKKNRGSAVEARQNPALTAKIKELENLTAKRALLAKRFDEHVEGLKEGTGKSIQLELARADLMREERVFEMIAARKLALQTELQAPARVKSRSPATAPKFPLVPVPYKEMLLASLVGLMLPMGLAMAREMTIRRIGDVDDLHIATKLTVLGEIARFPVRPTASRVLALPNRARRQMYVFAESIDSLRTNLVLCEELGKNQVLAITSATSGEGKTSVATSLTASIAAATKQKTLIIDADLRSPDVDNLLAVKSHPGLSDVLASKATIEQSIHRLGETNTYVLPAGKTRVNPHHFVQSDRISQLLEKLREEYATIIIDTPPILGASEALVYAKQSDIVLFCTLSEVSRARQSRLAVERLERSGANVVGAVMNGASVSRYPMAYGYDDVPLK